MKLFCKHKWEMLHSEVTKSKWEVFSEGMQSCRNAPWQVTDTTRKYIQICTCTKCGNIKKFVTES